MVTLTKAHCRPGLWAELANGWIVGPFVETDYDGIYVAFADGTWQVDLEADSSRQVVRVGPRETLLNE